MNFKRGKPKSARAGALCKPWKIMGNSKQAKNIKDLRNDEYAEDWRPGHQSCIK
jgi:hypothetical protein